MTTRRLEAVRQKLTESRLQALFVTHLPHVRYLTDFSGSSGICLITQRDALFVSDGRYTTQAHEEVEHFEILITRKNAYEVLAKKGLIPHSARAGIEMEYLSVAELQKLKKAFPRLTFVSAAPIIASLAAVKDVHEISCIRKAVEISERVLEKILTIITDGISELDVAAEISYWHRRFGAEADAFEPIVASGVRSALPHARPSEKTISTGEFVTLDFGCRFQGYHSDITRTVSVGKPSAELKRIYTTVVGAQIKALDSVRAKVAGRSLDRVARKAIEQGGYGKFFTHSLGHGLGLEVHELPRLSNLSDDVLMENNVVTVEPGVYVPDVGGVRIEDDVVVGKNGCELLSTSSKELTVL